MIFVKGLHRYQSSKFEVEKISANSADPGRMGSNWADRQIFFPNSNFDLWYLCSPLTKINV